MSCSSAPEVDHGHVLADCSTLSHISSLGHGCPSERRFATTTKSRSHHHPVRLCSKLLLYVSYHRRRLNRCVDFFSNIRKLPTEVLLHIYELLNPSDLENITSTCRALSTSVTDQIWEQAFLSCCVTAKGPIPRIGTTWKSEYLHRKRIKRDIQRGEGKTFQVEHGLGNGCSFSCDFKSNHAMIVDRVAPRFGLVLDIASGDIVIRGGLKNEEQADQAFEKWKFVRSSCQGVVVSDNTHAIALFTPNLTSRSWKYNKLSKAQSSPVSASASLGNLLVTGDKSGRIKCWVTNT